MAGTQSGDDDTGEDGVDEIQPLIYGVLSAPFLLASGTEPVGGGEPGQGGADDDVDDQHTDMTVDFGFVQQVSIGNLVFRDLNDDGIFDLNTDTGVDGVTVELWANDGGIAPVGSLITSDGGLYNFNVAPGSYYVRIPESQFQAGAALANLRSSTNATNPVAGADDDADENGLDNTVPNLAGVQTAAFTVSSGAAPTAANTETGHGADADDAADAESDLTIDLGFAPKPLYAGNLVFKDLNGDGRFSATSDVGRGGRDCPALPPG